MEVVLNFWLKKNGSFTYGTVLHDSKVAIYWFILLRHWQVTVTFSACKNGSDQFLSHPLDRPSQASQLIGQKKYQLLNSVRAKLGLGG